MKDFALFDIILAVCASVCLPGLGQFFELKYGRAFVFMFGSMAGYIFFPPIGFFLHAINVIDAAYPKFRNKNCSSKVLQER